MSKLNRSLLWTGFVVAIAACGDDVTVTPPPPPPEPGIRSVTVGPNPANIAVGDNLQFVASVTTDPGAATPTIAWSSSNPAVASVNATSGLALGVSPGTVAITATATSGTSTGAGSATLNVGAAPACQISSVSVTPTSAAIVVNQQLTAIAIVNGSAACTPAQLTVTWNSLSPSVATVGLNTGIITGVSGGTAVITATSVQDATKTAAMSILVGVPSPATVQIKSITQGGLGTPINLNNVFGQIEITLTIDRGDKQLSRVDALIGGQVVASQVFTSQPSPAENAPANAPVDVVLNVNTQQLRSVAGIFVPVVFNGQTAISAFLYVVGEVTPIASNAVPVLMNNPDAVLDLSAVGTPIAFTPTVTSPSVTVGGVTFFTGGVTTSFIYLAFSNRTPSSVTATLNAPCGTQTNTVVGGPTTGIIVTNSWDCVGVSGSFFLLNTPGSITVVWPVGTLGPDGSTLQPPSQFSTVSGAFQLPDITGAPENRWNLITPSPNPLPPAIAIDNEAPGVFVAGEDDVLDPGFPALWCGAPLDGPVPGCVAFQNLFDEQWINDAYIFSMYDPLTNPEGDWLVTDAGVGVDLANSGVLLADFATGACTGPVVTTGLDLAETVVSDGTPDGHRLCAFGTDLLGNTATSGPSNWFGVDGVRDGAGLPSVRIAGSTAAVPSIATSTVPGVSSTPNTTIFGNPALGSPHSLFVDTDQWGVEGIDDRSGFDQANLVQGTALVGPRYPADQEMTVLNPANNPRVVIACGFRPELNLNPQLSDNWVRAGHMPPFGLPNPGGGGELDCGTFAVQDAPGYYDVNMFVVDRAGNISTPILRNYAIDQYAAPVLAGIGASTPFYTPALPAPFFLFGTDDLEIVEADLTVNFPGMAAGQTRVLYPAAFVGARWDAILTNFLAAAPVSVPYWLSRFDQVCSAVGVPYASCPAVNELPAIASEFNNVDTDLDLVFEDDDKNATGVGAVALDVASQPSGFVSTGLLSLQTTPDVAEPWSSQPIPAPPSLPISWRVLTPTGAVTIVAEHRVSTSVIAPFFEFVYLAREYDLDLIPGFETKRICGTFPAPVLSDNGLNRFWTYTISKPTGTAQCTQAGGGNWLAIGVLGGAALATVPVP